MVNFVIFLTACKIFAIFFSRLTKFVSKNFAIFFRVSIGMEQHGVLVGCVDRAGRAGRDVFVFCAYLRIVGVVAHFSVDHGCLTSSEHPSKARVTQTSLDLAIIF